MEGGRDTPVGNVRWTLCERPFSLDPANGRTRWQSISHNHHQSTNEIVAPLRDQTKMAKQTALYMVELVELSMNWPLHCSPMFMDHIR